MTLKRCTQCTGRFSSYFFAARSQLCRLCVTRRELEEKLKEQEESLAAGKNTVDELVKTVESLKRRIESKEKSHDSVSAAIPPSAAALPTSPAASQQTASSYRSRLHARKKGCKAYATSPSTDRVLQQISNSGGRR